MTIRSTSNLAKSWENDRKDSAAQRGVRYFDTLFHIEEQIKDLSPEERRVKRNELARPILNELHDWAFRLNAAPKSLLGKAAHYTREQWQWLVGYLEDGRLEASNNRALSEQITYPQLSAPIIVNQQLRQRICA